MVISTFFRDVLGARLNNVRQSWGAVHPKSGRVFLRVWAHQLSRGRDGEEVRIDWKDLDTGSHGLPERKLHIRAIEEGAEAFGVVLTAVDPTLDRPTMRRFDETTLLRLGRLREDRGGTCALVTGRVSTAELRRRDSPEERLADDLAALRADRRLDETTRQRLIDARIGQRQFRDEVLAAWQNRCAVTGATTTDAIRASHIQPWRLSNHKERLDRWNGLPLVANLDALFDVGAITFDDSGKMLVSSRIPAAERRLLGIDGAARLRRAPSEQTRRYLAIHRSRLFRKQ